MYLLEGPSLSIIWLQQGGCTEEWVLRGNRHLAKLYSATCCFAGRDWYLGGKGGPSIQKQLLQQRQPHFTYNLWGIMQV